MYAGTAVAATNDAVLVARVVAKFGICDNGGGSLLSEYFARHCKFIGTGSTRSCTEKKLYERKTLLVMSRIHIFVSWTSPVA